jgi:MFS family permease
MDKKNSCFIISARGVSDFGAYLNMVALSTYVYIISHNVMYLGVFLACRVSGGIVASFVGSKFFRKFSGGFSLIIFDISRALLLSLLLILPISYQLKVLPLIAFGIGLGNSMFSIGLNSQLPYWISEKARVATNSWITSISATAIILGTFISGLLISFKGYNAVLIVNIITYLFAAILILPVKIQFSSQKAAAAKQNTNNVSVLDKLKNMPILASILLVTLADTLGSSAHNVGLPIISRIITPLMPSKTMGIILAVWASGKFSGARLTSLVLNRLSPTFSEKLFFAGVFLMSTGFILLFQQTNLSLLILLFAFFAGVGDGVAEVSLVSRIQIEADDLRLPLFSLLTFLQMTGFGIGMLLVSPFYEWWKPAQVIVLFHGIPLLILFWVIIFLIMHNRHYPKNMTKVSKE